MWTRTIGGRDVNFQPVGKAIVERRVEGAKPSVRIRYRRPRRSAWPFCRCSLTGFVQLDHPVMSGRPLSVRALILQAPIEFGRNSKWSVLLRPFENPVYSVTYFAAILQPEWQMTDRETARPTVPPRDMAVRPR